MRKWKILALAAIVIIAVGSVVFVVSRPKAGTVEWHKKEFLAAKKRLYGKTFANKVRHQFYRLTKRTDQQLIATWEDIGRLSSNQMALRKLGYLVDCTILLSDKRASEVITAYYQRPDPNPFVWVSRNEEGVAPDVVLVTAPRAELAAISNIVQEIDRRWPRVGGEASARAP